MLQHNGPSVGFALAGGVFLCCGNLATQYALVRIFPVLLDLFRQVRACFFCRRNILVQRGTCAGVRGTVCYRSRGV